MKIWFKSIVDTVVIAILLMCSIVFFPLFLFFGLILSIYLFVKMVNRVNEFLDYDIEQEDSQR